MPDQFRRSAIPAAGLRLCGLWLSCLIWYSPSAWPAATPVPDCRPSGKGDYQALVSLYDEFRARRDAQREEAWPDYRPEAVERRHARLRQMRERLDAIGVEGWDISRQVDYLAVRAEFDQSEFMFGAARPWARDPGFYVDRIFELAFTDLPVSGADKEIFERQLREVPALLDEARQILVDTAGEYAGLALRNLNRSDGVGHGHPYRAAPPAGVIGWYTDLYTRAEAQPELKVPIAAARDAIVAYRDWLAAELASWNAPAGVGEAALDWYLRQVKLMPYSAVQIEQMGMEELQRLSAALSLERHRNRGLPDLVPAASAEEYRERIEKTDAHIRRFLVEQDFITVPDFVGPLDTNVPWIKRPGGRNFWEEVQYRDPHPDHLHAVIPGHRFDALLAGRNAHPVRRHIADGARVEGWAVYLEEAALRTGLFDDLPRVRELIYIFGLFRAARVPADIWLQTNRATVQQVVDFWRDHTPYLDADVARVDAEIYLRRPPGYGLGYNIGMLQVRQLLADRSRQLGEDFSLREFHDQFLAAGRLPVSLIRWEMTGLDDEVRSLWCTRPLPLTR